MDTNNWLTSDNRADTMSAEHVCDREESNEEVQQLPSCLDWTAEEVAEWVERLGYPQYKVV